MAKQIQRVRSHTASRKLHEVIETITNRAELQEYLELQTAADLKKLVSFHGIRGAGRLLKDQVVDLLLSQVYKEEEPVVERPANMTQEDVEDVNSRWLANLKASQQKKDDASHLIVVARAGTGKTTTLIEGLKKVKGFPVSITPSDQQAAIWEEMCKSPASSSAGFVAFNKSVAMELKAKVPKNCAAMTMHSLGRRAIVKAFGQLELDNGRVADFISEELEEDIRILRRSKPDLVTGTESLVRLCKLNLVDYTSPAFYTALDNLVAHYDVDLGKYRRDIYELVPIILERCKNPADGRMDYNDMIWLPVVLDLKINPFDLLLVDEAQDLNRCQQELAKRAGRRLILCGDPKQAIYGFAGADVTSIPRMQSYLETTDRGCEVLPLNVTRRCGKRIVGEVVHIVPDFHAMPDAHEGNVTGDVYDGDRYHRNVGPEDMILSRVNAPLVSQCLRFIRAKRKARIIGRDIGDGLVNLVKSLRPLGVGDLKVRAKEWYEAEVKAENERKTPRESRLISLQDRYQCLLVFCRDVNSIQEVIDSIHAIFTDETDGIRLSSVHRAKGLEADRVFILEPKGAEMPHPMASSDWQKEQEMNLIYVARTRAIQELVYVR